MPGWRRQNTAVAVIFSTLLAWGIAPAVAQPAASASNEQLEQLARLEAELEAQQKQIEGLHHQLAAAAETDMNAARIEEMKQQIREVLSEQEFRESLVPSTLQAGYDRGFFIQSTDERFKIKFNGQFQFRWTHYATRTNNRYLSPGANRHDRTGFDWARLRLKISGHAYSKDLTYLMEFDSSAPNSYDTLLLYGYINYRVVDEFQIQAGIFRLASTRMDTSSTATLQMVEYVPMNSVFGLVRGVGMRFWGKLFKGKGEYYLDIVNSLATPTRTITTDEALSAQGHDNNPAILFRTVWALLGGLCMYPDSATHFTSPCDMEIHTEPALNVGFHYAFKKDEYDGTLRLPYPRRTFYQPGGFGLVNSDGMNINQFGVDAGFKYMGFSATAEYVVRVLDPLNDGPGMPQSFWFQATGDGSTVAQHGAYVQLGYFLPIPGWERKFEIVGRVGGISALAQESEGTWEYAGGLNYYIDGHRIKIQTDVTKISEVPISNSTYSLANVNDDALIWRVQLQVLF